MNSKVTLIPRNIVNRLLHLAQLSPEHEVCGLVSSLRGVAHHCYPVDNNAAQPDKLFTLDPRQQIAAMQSMRKNGETLFAIYHSHPTAPATPSPTDIAMATHPEALNLIISLNTKGVLELRGFNIIEKTAEEVELILSEN